MGEGGGAHRCGVSWLMMRIVRARSAASWAFFAASSAWSLGLGLALRRLGERFGGERFDGERLGEGGVDVGRGWFVAARSGVAGSIAGARSLGTGARPRTGVASIARSCSTSARLLPRPSASAKLDGGGIPCCGHGNGAEYQYKATSD